MRADTITNAVEEHYAAVARGEASCCGAPAVDVARSIGYSDEELALAGDANLGHQLWSLICFERWLQMLPDWTRASRAA